MKYAFIAPCIGVGGADMFMSGLVNNMSAECTGIAIQNHLTQEQVKIRKKTLRGIPVWQKDTGLGYFDSITYDKDFQNCCVQATKDADIIITWCTPHIGLKFDKPVIEIAQNSDEYAVEVCESNTEIVDFRVAVSTACKVCFEPKQSIVIPNAIDFNRCAPRKDRETLRTICGLTDEHKVLLFAGRFVDEKNPQALIEVLNHLPDNYVSLLVGTGDREEELFRQAQNHHDRVLFMANQYHLGDVFTMADIFVLLSDFEGLPLTVLEAMFAGLPCIVADIPYIREMTEQAGENIAVITHPRPSMQEFVAAIKEAETFDTSLARAFVYHNYNISKIAHIFEDYVIKCHADWHLKRMHFRAYRPTPQTQMTTVRRTNGRVL